VDNVRLHYIFESGKGQPIPGVIPLKQKIQEMILRASGIYMLILEYRCAMIACNVGERITYAAHIHCILRQKVDPGQNRYSCNPDTRHNRYSCNPDTRYNRYSCNPDTRHNSANTKVTETVTTGRMISSGKIVHQQRYQPNRQYNAFRILLQRVRSESTDRKAK